MRGYIVYALFVAAGFALWLVLFLAMRRKPGRTADRAGYFLVGPLHSYLRSRGYSLTRREIFGWTAVLLLMLLAPLFAWFLE